MFATVIHQSIFGVELGAGLSPLDVGCSILQGGIA